MLERRLKSSGGGWIISEGSGVLQRQLKSLHGVDWDISEVSGSSGGDGVWPWRLPENPFISDLQPSNSGVLGSPVSRSLPPLMAGYRTPVQPHTVTQYGLQGDAGGQGLGVQYPMLPPSQWHQEEASPDVASHWRPGASR